MPIEFAGGYVNTDEGVRKERGVTGHLKRQAGAYLGTLIAPGPGTGVGALIDINRRKYARLRTAYEPQASDQFAIGSPYKELSAKLDDLIEFFDPVNPELLEGLAKKIASPGVNPAAAVAPKIMGAGMATGGAPGPNYVGDFAKDFLATRRGPTSAITPPPAGATGGMATGAPAKPGALQNLWSKLRGQPGQAGEEAGQLGSANLATTGAQPPTSTQPGATAQSSWIRPTAIGAGIGVGAGLGTGYALTQNQRRNFIALLDDLITFQDPRPRNRLGEFASQQEGGPDPNAMVRTYRQGPGLAGVAGSAAIGAAVGTATSEGIKHGLEHLKTLRKVKV